MSSKKRKLRHVLTRKKDELKQSLPTITPSLSEDVPRITNETVAAHREEVIGKARKYKYPLQHSKHKIVLISASLFIVGVVAFFVYCTAALYKFQSTSTFIYRVTQVVPFPVAKADGRYVSYESYLFELRHYVHYYQNYAKQDFTPQQLDAYKKTALNQVVADAYVKQLADEHHISVSDQEVNDEITIVQSQNRLGTNQKELEDVLRDYWGWSLDDFKRSLRTELLAQKVASTLDTADHARAQAALDELNNGTPFATVAAKYSDDPTKTNGGSYGTPIDISDRELPAQVTAALFKLQPGQYSGIIYTGYTLEIVKNVQPDGDKIDAAHIVIGLKDIGTYVNDLQDQHKARLYLTPN